MPGRAIRPCHRMRAGHRVRICRSRRPQNWTPLGQARESMRFFFDGWFRVGEMQVPLSFPGIYRCGSRGLGISMFRTGVPASICQIIRRTCVVKMDGENASPGRNSRIETALANTESAAANSRRTFSPSTDFVALASSGERQSLAPRRSGEGIASPSAPPCYRNPKWAARREFESETVRSTRRPVARNCQA